MKLYRLFLLLPLMLCLAASAVDPLTARENQCKAKGKKKAVLDASAVFVAFSYNINPETGFSEPSPEPNYLKPLIVFQKGQWRRATGQEFANFAQLYSVANEAPHTVTAEGAYSDGGGCDLIGRTVPALPVFSLLASKANSGLSAGFTAADLTVFEKHLPAAKTNPKVRLIAVSHWRTPKQIEFWYVNGEKAVPTVEIATPKPGGRLQNLFTWHPSVD